MIPHKFFLETGQGLLQISLFYLYTNYLLIFIRSEILIRHQSIHRPMEIKLTTTVVSHTLKIGADGSAAPHRIFSSLQLSPLCASSVLARLRNPRVVSMGSKKRSPLPPPTATAPDDVCAPPAGKAPVVAVPQPPDVALFLTKRPTPSSCGAPASGTFPKAEKPAVTGELRFTG
jgi:hypothetical protein